MDTLNGPQLVQREISTSSLTNHHHIPVLTHHHHVAVLTVTGAVRFPLTTVGLHTLITISCQVLFSPDYQLLDRSNLINYQIPAPSSIPSKTDGYYGSSDETLNRGPLALLLWRQYEFPFGINIVQFSIFQMRDFDIFCLVCGFCHHYECF